jgi:hypothetical protein
MNDINLKHLERLRFIDFLLDHYGMVDRSALVDYFGIGPAQATRDLRQYAAMAPGNMVLNQSTKKYLRAETYARMIL